jgi:3-methyladenine DNA glycosylase AlkD
VIIAKDVQTQLAAQADPDRIPDYMRFFKTGPGQYGEGDVFIGVTVPKIRRVVKPVYAKISLTETIKLLKSKTHEDRFAALAILCEKFAKADSDQQAAIYALYLKHKRHINNWDLIDTSAHKILGPYLFKRDKAVLYKLAGSSSLWERRIAVISTFYFIHHKHFEDSLKLAGKLINDEHDLIHKAVGWMIREVGKRDYNRADSFLRKYYHKMPRTMLRYAIERFPEKLRQDYLKGRR